MRESESERETETDRRREKERKSVKILNKLSKAFRRHFSDLKLSDPKKLTFQWWNRKMLKKHRYKLYRCKFGIITLYSHYSTEVFIQANGILWNSSSLYSVKTDSIIRKEGKQKRGIVIFKKTKKHHRDLNWEPRLYVDVTNMRERERETYTFEIELITLSKFLYNFFFQFGWSLGQHQLSKPTAKFWESISLR